MADNQQRKSNQMGSDTEPPAVPDGVVVHYVEHEHQCRPWSNGAPGTVWKCRCGQLWVKRAGGTHNSEFTKARWWERRRWS